MRIFNMSTVIVVLAFRIGHIYGDESSTDIDWYYVNIYNNTQYIDENSTLTKNAVQVPNLKACTDQCINFENGQCKAINYDHQQCYLLNNGILNNNMTSERIVQSRGQIHAFIEIGNENGPDTTTSMDKKFSGYQQIAYQFHHTSGNWNHQASDSENEVSEETNQILENNDNSSSVESDGPNQNTDLAIPGINPNISINAQSWKLANLDFLKNLKIPNFIEKFNEAKCKVLKFLKIKKIC